MDHSSLHQALGKIYSTAFNMVGELTLTLGDSPTSTIEEFIAKSDLSNDRLNVGYLYIHYNGRRYFNLILIDDKIERISFEQIGMVEVDKYVDQLMEFLITHYYVNFSYVPPYLTSGNVNDILYYFEYRVLNWRFPIEIIRDRAGIQLAKGIGKDISSNRDYIVKPYRLGYTNDVGSSSMSLESPLEPPIDSPLGGSVRGSKGGFKESTVIKGVLMCHGHKHVTKMPAFIDPSTEWILVDNRKITGPDIVGSFWDLKLLEQLGHHSYDYIYSHSCPIYGSYDNMVGALSNFRLLLKDGGITIVLQYNKMVKIITSLIVNEYFLSLGDSMSNYEKFKAMDVYENNFRASESFNEDINNIINSLVTESNYSTYDVVDDYLVFIA